MKKYLALCILCLVAISCSDDIVSNNIEDGSQYFNFEEGQVFQYNYTFYIENDENPYNNEVIHYIGKPSIINGRECFEYFIEHSPVRVDHSGLSFYYENFNGAYAKIFPELKDKFIKIVSFNENKWTHFDLKKDTVSEIGENITYEFKVYGEKIEDLMIDYKGEQHEAIKTRLLTYGTAYNTQSKEVRYSARNSGFEFITLKDIGLYEFRNTLEGVISENYERLVDHK
jgi:hypothetical protein